MTPLAIEARRVHQAAQLSDRQIAAATGAQPSTVRDWLSARSRPTGERAQLLIELAEMTDRLARVMRADYIAVWLTGRCKPSMTTSPWSCWPAARTAAPHS